MRELYAQLQVHPRADPVVIRAAYYALARKHHPDAGGDPRKMIDLNTAWEILGDPVRRAAYDRARARPTPPAQASARPEAAPEHEAGPTVVPGRRRSDESKVLDFGRYAGWSLEQLAESDPDYLRWLVRTSIGRRMSAEVESLLAVRATTGTAVRLAPRPGRRQFRSRK